MRARRLVLLAGVVSQVVAAAEPAGLPECPVTDGTCFGEVRYTTGDRYLGEMHVFKMDGTGVMFSADGGVKEAGTWSAGKNVSEWNVDFGPYVAPYPKFKTALLEAIRVLEARRDRQLVEVAMQKEPPGPWDVRVANVVASASKAWLEGNGNAVEELVPPVLAPAKELTRESWESKKEFEARVAADAAERKKAFAAAQAEYKTKLADQKVELKRLGAERAQKSKKLAQVKKAFALHASSLVDLKVAPKSARFDPDSAVLSLELSIDGAPAERYDFRNAPPELRKVALERASTLTFSPEFTISPAGQVSLRALRATTGSFTAAGVRH